MPDQAARNAVVEANLPLVKFHLRGRLAHCRGWVDGDDLIQEGSLGLIRAVEKHDPERGALSHYSRAWIQSLAHDASLRACHPCTVSLRVLRRQDRPVAKGSSRPLDALQARADRFDLQEDRNALDALWAAVERLGEPYRTVIRLRYGEGLLQPEIGERMGYSKQWVQQIEARAIRRLRGFFGEERG